MIKEDVTISLVSTQSDGKNSEQSEIITKGTYKKIDDRYVISYKETEATGFDGATTELSVYGDEKVVMNRTGDFMSNLIVEMGKKHHCQTKTKRSSKRIYSSFSEVHHTVSGSRER